ncbi:hypothetical protein RIU17_03530 [Riemerella anatipestifer]|nr:hypothetical protein [Riemerella anatipestifer]
MIQIDSSIFLDLIGIVNNRNLPKNNIERAINFIEYQQTHKVDVSAALAVQELVLDRNSKKYNIEMYSDYANKFLFSLNLSRKQILNRSFYYDENFSKKRHEIPPMDYGDMRVNICNRSYVVLLKIREIVFKNGVNERNALKNIQELLHWMKYELGIMMAFELQLAVYILGGINDFTEMIWLKKDKTQTFQRLWGTAMDISFFRFLQIMESFKKELGINDISIFATKDKKQFRLIKAVQTTTIIKNLPNNPILSQVELDISGTFYGKNESEFRLISNEYSGSIDKKEYIFNEENLLLKIEELEKVNKDL